MDGKRLSGIISQYPGWVRGRHGIYRRSDLTRSCCRAALFRSWTRWRCASYFSKFACGYDVQRSDSDFVCRRADGCNSSFVTIVSRQTRAAGSGVTLYIVYWSRIRSTVQGSIVGYDNLQVPDWSDSISKALPQSERDRRGIHSD